MVGKWGNRDEEASFTSGGNVDRRNCLKKKIESQKKIIGWLRDEEVEERKKICTLVMKISAQHKGYGEMQMKKTPKVVR